MQLSKAPLAPQRRIMIIDPPFKRLYHDNASLVKFPLALGYLSGAVLKWTDWEVQAYNADFNPQKRAITLDNVTPHQRRYGPLPADVGRSDGTYLGRNTVGHNGV